jgi:hypothetical protein
MRGSAIRFALHSACCGALPLMAHPQRSAADPCLRFCNRAERTGQPHRLADGR